jgi:hypothetical protein
LPDHLHQVVQRDVELAADLGHRHRVRTFAGPLEVNEHTQANIGETGEAHRSVFVGAGIFYLNMH